MPNTAYHEDALLAANMFEEDGNGQWRNATLDEKRDYLIRACHINDARRREEREAEARRVKLAQVDAYRARIAGTIPAHRLDTRMNGFMDGWDAAMRHMQEQGQ